MARLMFYELIKREWQLQKNFFFGISLVRDSTSFCSEVSRSRLVIKRTNYIQTILRADCHRLDAISADFITDVFVSNIRSKSVKGSPTQTAEITGKPSMDPQNNFSLH